MSVPMHMVNSCSDQGLVVGAVIANDVGMAETPFELRQIIDSLIKERQTEEFPPPELKEAVRAMLRTKEYKPTGRGKPASEYLAQAAREGRFPCINAVVDIINYLSLRSGLPISLLDADVVGAQVEIRRGLPHEKYVFNAAGQEIDLHGLVCVCGNQDGCNLPYGNPVKDSMQGKVTGQTKNVLGVVYCPASGAAHAGLRNLLTEFSGLLSRFSGAQQTQECIVP